MQQAALQLQHQVLTEMMVGMQTELKTRFAEIAGRIDPGFRTQARRDLESVLRTGARSLRDLHDVLRAGRASEKVLIKVCWVLGRMGDKRSVFVLLEALQNGSPGLRSAAARALGELQSARAVTPLIRALLRDDDAGVRMAAAHALGTLRATEAFKSLVNTLRDRDEEPKVRGMAAEALAVLCDKRAVRPLIAALRDESVDVRFWATFALGELASTLALPELERIALTDDRVLPGWWAIKLEASNAVNAIRSRSCRAA